MTDRLPAPERRKQILKHAVRVLARSNYQSARMADIAAQVGISEAAVYKYFPSKRAVYLEILRHMSQRIITFWHEEIDREPDAAVALGNMGRAYLRRMIAHPDEVRVQFQAVAEVNDPVIKERLCQDHLEYVRFIGDVIRRGQRHGCIRPEVDATALAWLLDGVGVLMNLTSLLSLQDEFNEETVTAITNFVMNSIAMPGKTGE